MRRKVRWFRSWKRNYRPRRGLILA